MVPLSHSTDLMPGIDHVSEHNDSKVVDSNSDIPLLPPTLNSLIGDVEERLAVAAGSVIVRSNEIRKGSEVAG